MSEEDYNPYTKAKRTSLVDQQKRDFDFHDGPQLLINDDPKIPDYKLQGSYRKHTDYSMKIVVVGDGGCGKTCLLVSYSQKKFPEVYVPTVFENYVAHVASPTGNIIEVALWDTAGQEEYDRLRPLSYPDVDILLVCFALDNIVSLQNVKDIWYPEVSHFCPGIPLLLVGTKSDLNIDMDPDLPIQLATEMNAIGYVQCSAKTMFNVNSVFNFAMDHFEKQKRYEERLERTSKNRISRAFHSRNHSSSSYKKHKNTSSIESAKLLEAPLSEEPPSNPYATTAKYNEDEFAFTRKNIKKKKRCIIL